MRVIASAFFVLCGVTSLVLQTNGSKLLLVFPTPAPSHYILGNRLMHILCDRGHQVTLIAPYEDENLPKNCREIHLSDAVQAVEKMKGDLFFKTDMSKLTSKLRFMREVGKSHCETTLSHPAVQKLLNDPNETFDAVIVEEFINHALKYFAYHFKAPLISFSTVGATAWTNSLVGNPAPVSYIPDPNLPYTGTMNFWQRVHNSWIVWFKELHERFVFYPTMDEVLRKYFPEAPSVDDLAHNVSLVLLNSHVSTNQPVPLLPNMVEIGGFHVDPPERLPENLQTFLDGSQNGVVYFSMGSTLRSKFMPVQTREVLLSAFAKLKLDVLWKWEEDVLPGQPPNVKLRKWVPQQDVLAHPNVKLFVTHAGLLSMIETIHHGVPILAIPVAADQKLNAANAVENGIGVQVSFRSLTEEALTAALREVLSNPKYAENAKKRSILARDRIVSPRDAVIYWTEHVVRHGGARHFRSPALDLMWYQLYSLDIVVATIGVIAGVLSLLRKLFIRLFRKSVVSIKRKND